MNVNQLTWKDAFSHKYVILCLICGSLLLLLGLAFIVIYLILSSYTSSLHYFETIPTYIPAITLIVNGIIVCILAKRHLRYFYLIKISGAFCLICALICVVTTVTTTVIHLNRLQNLQGCEYTASSSTCICMTGSAITGSNDPSVQVTGHSSHYAFQNIPNCDVVHGSLNTCLRALFGVSVFGILISIFTSMLVYQLMSHEKKRKYLEQLESRRRFHQHAFSRRGHDPLGPPFPLLSYPPPHALAAQGCSAFMDDIFYPTNGSSGNVPGRGGWMWPAPPPPPWDLIDYRSYCTPTYDGTTGPCPTSSPSDPNGTTSGDSAVNSPEGTGVRVVEDAARNESEYRTLASFLFSWLFNREQRENRRQRTSRRLLSREQGRGRTINSTECPEVMVTENRFNHRSPNRYGLLPPPHSPPPPPPPLTPTLPPPHHPLLPVGHFSPLLVPLHPSYRSAIRNRSLARLNTRRTRSNDAIFHHLHSMAYAHPPPPPFYNGPPLLNSPQSLFAAWGPPPPYSQPSSMENIASGHNNDSNGVNNNSSASQGNTNTNNLSHDVNNSNHHHRNNNNNNNGMNRRHNQINSASNGLVDSDGYDNSSSKLSTPISERRMLCNAFSSDGITLTIGGPVVTTPSKSSCIVEVHVQDDPVHHDVTSTLNSESIAFNSLHNKKKDELTYHHNSYKSLSNVPINLSSKQFSVHHDMTKSIDSIIYEQNESNEDSNFECIINENYLDKDDAVLTNVSRKPSVIYNTRTSIDSDCSKSENESNINVHPNTIVIPTVPSTIIVGSSTSTFGYSSSTSSDGTHNFSSPTSQSVNQLMNVNSVENFDPGHKCGEYKNCDLNVNQSNSSSVSVGFDEVHRAIFNTRSNSIKSDCMATINDNLSNQASSSDGNQSNLSTSSTTTTTATNPLSTLNSNTKEANCPETGSHQGKVIGSNETGKRQEMKYMQTQSMPNLSYVAAVSIAASPSHHTSSATSSCQVTPQHESKDGKQYPSSGNTSTSQDIADLELELDEEPLCYLPDLPYDGSHRAIKPNSLSELSNTPQYLDINVTKIKPPTPFANCPSEPTSESSSSTISNNTSKSDEIKNHLKPQSTGVGENMIVTIRSIQV